MNTGAMPEGNFADLARLSCRVASVSISLIGFRSEGGIQLAVESGMNLEEEGFACNLCERMLVEGGRLEIADLTREGEIPAPEADAGMDQIGRAHV